jgi:hypothetical protein
VLEIRRARAAIVACHARPGDLQELRAQGGLAGAEPYRIAPDEGWLVGPPEAAAEILARAHERHSPESGALVVDESDGWILFELSGGERLEPFAALAEFPLPEAPAFVQGAFAGVPAKIVVEPAAIRLFVPSPFGDYVERRLRAATAPSGPAARWSP